MSSTVVAPREERPYEGFLTIRAELGPMAGASYESNARSTSEDEARFERVLDKTLRRSDVLDKEALCLIAGKQVFSVSLAVRILNSGGGSGGGSASIGAAVLAGIVALRHYRRPEFSIQGSEAHVFSPAERVPVPLALHHMPFALEHALFTLRAPKAAASGAVKGSASLRPAGGEGEGSVIAVPDPSALEARLAEGRFVAVLNAHREVCLLEKSGGAPLEADALLALLARAAARVQELHEQVEQALRDDLKTRPLGGF